MRNRNNGLKEDKEYAEIIRSVQQIGTKKVLNALKKIQTESLDKDVIIDLTINTIINEWDNKYTREQLFGLNIRGELVSARTAFIIVSNRITLLGPTELHRYMDSVSARVIRDTLYRFSVLDCKNKFDKVIIERVEKVIEIVKGKLNLNK